MIDELEKRIASARKSLNHAEHERRETGATGRAPARGKSYEELLAALREI